MSDTAVEITGLHKSFGRHEVLRGIDLAVSRGEVVCIIGPSGSGKSTLLRCVNLLEVPTSGTVVVDGHDMTDPDVDIDAARQSTGMVFQQFNLFSHLCVLDNLTRAQRRVLGRTRSDAERIAPDEPRPRRVGGPRRRLTWAAVRRAAAAGCHRSRAVDGSVGDAVRRTDVGTPFNGWAFARALSSLAAVVVIAAELAIATSLTLVELGPPEIDIASPAERRTREFLARVLHALNVIDQHRRYKVCADWSGCDSTGSTRSAVHLRATTTLNCRT